jgi:serine protease Do
MRAKISVLVFGLILGASTVHGQELPELSPAQAYDFIKPSIVFITVLKKKTGKTHTGSGVVVEDGLVVTNCHVIKDVKKIEVSQGEVRLAAKHVEPTLIKLDLCMLKPSQPIGKEATLAHYKPSIGDTVYALGHPLAMNLAISTGIINAWQMVDGVAMIQHSAATSYGSSGGGLFDSRGRLIGITTMIENNFRGINWAVRADVSTEE